MDLRSGQPFWPLKDGLPGSYPALSREESCEVVIIGGGITDALIAYHLAEEGVDIVLLDKRDVGMGCTAASTSLLQYEIDTELADRVKRVGEADAVRAYWLGLEAITRVEELVGRLGDDCGFTRRASLYLASKSSHVSKLQSEHDCRRRFGFDVEYLAPDRIREEYGFSAPAAILSTGDAEIDAFRLTHALLRRCRSLGLQP
ncbi:NAD(P)/FAD-dependent oxidoreductase [Singulisphaera rosea]